MFIIKVENQGAASYFVEACYILFFRILWLIES